MLNSSLSGPSAFPSNSKAKAGEQSANLAHADFFATNEDGADDNLAPERLRTKGDATTSRVNFSGSSNRKDDRGGGGSGGGNDGGGGGGDPNKPRVRRSTHLTDEIGRLPTLPDFTSGFKCSYIASLIRFGLEFITRNGQTTYKTPIPPPSDVNELEYISALHQCSSMSCLRLDCSIHADEVALYLKSRHGLCVSPEVVRRFILQDGLTADKDESRPSQEDGGGGVIDLVELMSALVIPNLMRLQRKHLDKKRISTAQGKARDVLETQVHAEKSDLKEKKKHSQPQDDVDILKDILSLMLEDCTGDATAKTIDEDLVKDLLCGYGEGALALDSELVRQMVEVARAGSGSTLSALASTDTGVTGEEVAPPALLDLDAFVAALTSDVARKYDPGREKRRSTNFEDVWYHRLGCEKESVAVQRDEEMEMDEYVKKLNEETLGDTLPCGNKCRKVDEDKDPQDYDATTGKGMTVRRLFTGPAIDYTADTFRTRFQIISLWVAFVLFYVAYLFFGQGVFQPAQCGEETAEARIACPLIGGIVNQLLMIAELIVFGAPFIVLGSVGNSIEGKKLCGKWL